MTGRRPARPARSCLLLVVAALLQSSPPLLGQLAPPPAGRSTASVPPTVPGLAPPPPVVSSPHLDASPSVIFGNGAASGQHVALVVTVTPKPGMHVYAPGNPSYTPVALQIERPSRGTIGPTVHSKAETYFFAPLNERVMVYGSAFRMSRVLKAGSEGLPRSVQGTLEYQACDDKVCYRPQTLPLTWQIEK